MPRLTLHRLAQLAGAVALAGCALGPVIEPEVVRARFGFGAEVDVICRSGDILGQRIPPVGQTASNPACGFDDAVRVYAISGVALTPPARMNCRTARTARNWINRGAQRAAKRAGEELRRVHVISDYSCRTRNHRPGARLSEHAKGTAIDVSGFSFASGTRLTVAHDWEGANARLMRALFRAACRNWSTAIGPDGDRFHQHHFHLDATVDYGPGGYCR